MRIGSLCTGYGGLDGAAAEVLGGEPAFVADNDDGAARILTHRFPAVPNLGDITTIDWDTVEPVDILCAGFPCQPVSNAGKRLGEADERWIWPAVADAVRHLRPSYVYLENVAALLTRGLDGVLAGLAQIGYVGSWRCIRASDVGAPHRRERIFILARPAPHPESRRDERPDIPAGLLLQPVIGSGKSSTHTECGELQRRRNPAILGDAPPGEPGERHQRQRAGHPFGDRRPGVAAILGGQGLQRGGDTTGRRPRPAIDDQLAKDADSTAGDQRRITGPGQTPVRWPRADAGGSGGTRTPADTNGGQLKELKELDSRQITGIGGASGDNPERHVLGWRQYGPAIHRWEAVLGRPAPPPTQTGRNGQRLSPAFVEWLMGLPEGWVTAVPGLSRNAQLKALGNGVVPHQAAYALRMLLETISGSPHDPRLRGHPIQRPAEPAPRRRLTAAASP